jgi:hypothetical protein
MRRICMQGMRRRSLQGRATDDVGAEVGNPTLRRRVESPRSDLPIAHSPIFGVDHRRTHQAIIIQEGR